MMGRMFWTEHSQTAQIQKRQMDTSPPKWFFSLSITYHPTIHFPLTAWKCLTQTRIMGVGGDCPRWKCDFGMANRPIVLVFGFWEKTGGSPHFTCHILQTLNPHHHLTGHRKLSPSKRTFDLMSISIDFNKICIFSSLIRVYSHGAQTHQCKSPWCVGWMNDKKTKQNKN